MRYRLFYFISCLASCSHCKRCHSVKNFFHVVNYPIQRRPAHQAADDIHGTSSAYHRRILHPSLQVYGPKGVPLVGRLGCAYYVSSSFYKCAGNCQFFSLTKFTIPAFKIRYNIGSIPFSALFNAPMIFLLYCFLPGHLFISAKTNGMKTKLLNLLIDFWLT